MKKAALNLSVEAIIIFVLAFAMLGVGIFITDQLREIGGESLKEAKGILEQIGETPTADKPLVGITKQGIDIKYNDESDLYIGFYNKERTSADRATILIDECKSTSTGDISGYATDGEYPVIVVSSTINVAPSTAEGFIASLTNNNLESGEKYICKLKIVDEDSPATEYYSYTTFLNVIS